MRRFATWTTGHRKTVIISWIVALVGFGILAGAVGSDFTEEFSLPSSDSKDALDLLENRFPAQAGDSVQIVYKAESGVESPAVKRTMEGVFTKVEEFPHVSEVASPYEKGGAGAVSDDGEIAYATAQFNVTTDKLGDDEVKKIMDTARDAGGDGLQVEVGGSPAEEVRERRRRRRLGDDRRARRDHRPADQLRLGRRDGTADHHRAVRARGRDQRHHPLHPRLRHGGVRAAAGVHDRARRRGRLRPLHPHPLPQRSRRGAGEARSGDRRRRHRRPRGALRRDHGDHLADGDAAARPPLPLRGRDRGGDRGPVHDDRGADPAACPADDRRQLGQPAADPRPRQGCSQHRREQLVVPLEPSHPAASMGRGAARGRSADRPLHPHPLAAPRHQRRRHRPGGDDHARSLRPARRRLRPRLQRAVPAGRGAAGKGRRQGPAGSPHRA